MRCFDYGIVPRILIAREWLKRATPVLVLIGACLVVGYLVGKF